MKCALDFIAIKSVAVAEWEAEEALKDEKARKEYETLTPRSIDFCDTVVDTLFTEKAINREPLIHSFKGIFSRNRVGQTIFTPLVEDGHVYNTGEKSFTKGNVSFAYDTIKAYLENHCFTVERGRNSYRQYGSGFHGCDTIIVSIPKVEG